MESLVQIIVSVICATIASGGFWAYLQHMHDKNDAKSDMLMGLGHDRIVDLGMRYIERGWITKDEYENLNDYLYKPYEKMKGNGSAKRVMNEVARLPLRL